MEALRNSEWRTEGSRADDVVSESITGRILLVDDDPHFLRVLSRILTRESFQVTATTDAHQAIELLASASFDLIICDLRMPDCDGINLLQVVRRAGNDIPIIILTAYGEVDTYLEAMNAGATEYLNKPINSEDLLKVVRLCLLNHGRRRNTRRKNAA